MATRRPRNLSEIRLRLEDAVRDIPIERVVTVVVAEIDLEAARAIQQDAELFDMVIVVREVEMKSANQADAARNSGPFSAPRVHARPQAELREGGSREVCILQIDLKGIVIIVVIQRHRHPAITFLDA